MSSILQEQGFIVVKRNTKQSLRRVSHHLLSFLGSPFQAMKFRDQHCFFFYIGLSGPDTILSQVLPL